MPLVAQPFTGTNAPNAGTNFNLSLPPSATNVSLVVSNTATAYSHLFLKLGGTPTTNDFSYVARLNGQTNQISLEASELTNTSVGLRVFTPATSLQHSFRVTVLTNHGQIRSAAFPASKPVVFSTTGSLTNSGGGAWHYYQVDVPTNLPGWRIVLSSTGSGNPNLYVRRGAVPSTSSSDKSSTTQDIDTIIFSNTEATDSTYFIGVHLPSGTASSTAYTLSTELGYLTTLTWDPGATHEGTQVFNNSSAIGGEYYFKITAQSSAVGAFRTALKVISGEADVYLRKDTFATGTSSYSTKQSTQVGSDGFVLSSSEFSAGQDFYILVRATAGAQWALVSGEAYVLNLGSLAPAGSAQTSTNVTVGPEGTRFFKTTVPAGTLAWRLGLNGGTNDIFVRKNLAPSPFSSTTYDQKQSGQMLLVPTYLAGGSVYLVGIPGAPNTVVDLDCRQQTVTDLAFSGTTNFSVNGFGYTTFRVQVPVQQIAWMAGLQTTVGDANLSIRRGSVANEWNNDAFSEVSGLGTESVLMVPPSLSDGTFYVTVYGKGAYTCTLSSGNPTISDVPFVGRTTNDASTLVGWRLYRVPDINSQLGYLGWDLFLSNCPPGTEIALRRNAVPGRWNYRNGGTTISSQGNVDFSSTAGFLQRQDHPADIWYIGVYSSIAPLGQFVLDRRAYQAATVEPVGNATNVVAQPANEFRYFRVDIPAGILGWDLRLTNVTSGDPRLVVRRDRLPDSLTSHTDSSSSGWSASGSTTWPSSYQWAAGSDWTGLNSSPTGVNESGRILSMGVGNPLEPGTYYVGVTGTSSATTPLSYSLLSRFIGAGQAIVPGTLPLNGGSVSIVNLQPREVAYYAVTVPTNTASMRLKLTADAGESTLLVQRTVIPNIGASSGRSPYSVDGGAKISKAGDDVYFLLPASGQTNISAGTYYIGVVSEGMNPTSSRIGTNASSATLSSLGELPLQSLGTLGPADIVQADTIPSAELKAYRFTLPAGLLGVELRLENRVGNPRMALRSGNSLPASPDNYGNYGGQTATWSDASLIYLPNPTSGEYTLLIQAASVSSTYPAASFTIRLHPVGASGLAFDGGSLNVVNQSNDTWRFFSVTVPSNTFGWDLRLANVTSGDPRLAVRRSAAPFSLSTVQAAGGQGWGVASATSWPIGNQWAIGTDYTGYSQDWNGTNRSGHTMTAGMGNPVEAGDYIVGVYTGTGSGSANPMSYTISSRGVGPAFSIPIQTINFSNGTASLSGMAPREFAFYKIAVPSNTPNWKLTLAATVGDSLLAFQKDALPNIGAGGSLPYGLTGGHQLKKVGNEVHVLLPANNQTNIPAGDYYLAVVSEGLNPTLSRTGTNTSSATLTSVGPVEIGNLGTLTAGSDINFAGSLPAAELQFHQFTVDPGVLSLQLRLTNRVGNPKMSLRRGSLIPKATDSYGNNGGSTAEWSDVSFIDIPNPTPGLYTLTVQAGALSSVYVDASYTLLLQATGSTPLSFNGGIINVTNQPSGVWRYYYVTIPSNAAGWDLRLTNVTSGDPRLVVRRDQLPTSLSTVTSGSSGWGVATASSWPTGYQWAASSDWTGYAGAADGSNETGHLIAGGMGSPLSPGNYYVGVFNGTGPGNANPMSYTLVSRGIGSGYTIPINPLNFIGTVSSNSLPVRETAYYQITLASNVPNWKLRLSPSVGQAVLTVNKAALPNVLAGDSSDATKVNGGHRMQRVGNEYYFLLPSAGETNVPAGDYFVAVTSEGVNPTSTRTGSNIVSYVLSSLGVVNSTNLGTLSAADLVTNGTLEGGEISLYQFTIPPGVPNIEVRLDDQSGGPKMSLRRGNNFPAAKDAYGRDGGETATWEHTNSITIANPIATNYSLTIQAPSTWASATFTVRVHGAPLTALNFAPNLNTNGLSNTASGTLLDNQRAYYRITVPATNNGAAVIGWRLNLDQTTGAASLRARKDLLPSDADSSLMPFTVDEAVLVPPFLTPGTWYVEVKATGTTTYTVTSREVQLERAWSMPMIAQPSTTPGLVSPDFGDSGVATNGVALSGDQGVDVDRGGFHYYGIDVPEFNGGIMRVVLEAISGNPDFYLRYQSLPTVTHNGAGVSGSLYDRLLNSTGTEYANWVALDGRYEKSLTPGRWYVAVQAAGNSNARYRLRLSTGTVQDIPLHGANLSSQVVAAKDFRYYRVIVPTNAPTAWQISFNQQIGDVLMYVRDTVPPGQAESVTQFKDWSSDNKNHATYPTYDNNGTYTLNTAPLRPGHTYFLGFRGISDATFSLTTSTNGSNINVAGTLDFYTGSITNSIPPFSKMTWRIDVPSDARRLRLTNTAPSSIKWYLDQGTLPTLTASDHWNSTGNILLNQALTGTWPWLPAQMYFLTVTNTAATTQNFVIHMEGRNCLNDDNDSDGLPDCWEVTYFGGTSQPASGDPDNDGNNNLLEYQDSTDPTLSTSMLARLTILTNGPGSVAISAAGPYPYGTMVTLTATPAASHVFAMWTGTGFPSTPNPLSVAMTTNRTITANFSYDYGAPGLTRADYRFANTLASSVGNPPDLELLGPSYYFEHMIVDGIARPVLSFAWGNGLQLRPTTTVFPSNTYSVAILFQFDTVSGYRRILDTKNGSPDQGLYVHDGRLVLYPLATESPVCMTNGVWYQLVLTRDAANRVKVYVDGTLRLDVLDSSNYATLSSANAMRFFKDNATEDSGGYVARIRTYATALSATEVANLDRSIPLRLSNTHVDGSGAFNFTVTGPEGINFEIKATANFTNWTTLTNIEAFPGEMNFVLPKSAPMQFLRLLVINPEYNPE